MKTVLLIIIVIGAIIGFARSDADKFSERLLSAFGGAFVAVLIAGALIMVANIGSGGSEDNDASDYPSGRP